MKCNFFLQVSCTLYKPWPLIQGHLVVKYPCFSPITFVSRYHFPRIYIEFVTNWNNFIVYIHWPLLTINFPINLGVPFESLTQGKAGT